jgi:hypothetical protein
MMVWLAIVITGFVLLSLLPESHGMKPDKDQKRFVLHSSHFSIQGYVIRRYWNHVT